MGLWIYVLLAAEWNQIFETTAGVIEITLALRPHVLNRDELLPRMRDEWWEDSELISKEINTPTEA